MLVIETGYTSDVARQGAPIVTVFDGNTGEARLEITAGRAQHLHAIEFSSDASRFMTVTGEGDHHEIWDSETGERLFGVVPLEPVSFTSDGRHLMVGGWRVHDAVDGSSVVSRTCIVDPYASASDLISRDGSRMIHSVDTGAGFRVTVCDAFSGRVLTVAENVTMPHRGSVSPDGKLFVGARAEGGAIVWDLETGSAIAQLDGLAASPLAWAMFMPDGTLVGGGAGDGVLTLWSLADLV